MANGGPLLKKLDSKLKALKKKMVRIGIAESMGDKMNADQRVLVSKKGSISAAIVGLELVRPEMVKTDQDLVKAKAAAAVADAAEAEVEVVKVHGDVESEERIYEKIEQTTDKLAKPYQKDKIKYARIEYTLNEDGHGFTSLSMGGSTTQQAISAIFAEKVDATLTLFDRMKEYAHPNFVRVLFLDDFENTKPIIVTERVDHSMDSWSTEKYNKWSRGNQSQSWPMYIGKDVNKILRDIMKGLVHMYKKDVYHNNIKNGIAICRGTGKLYKMIEGELEFEKGIAKDFEDLKEVVENVFKLDKGQEMPIELKDFFAQKTPTNIMHDGGDYRAIVWFYDDSSLWTRHDNIDFVHNLQWILKFKIKIQSSLNTYFNDFEKWPVKVSAGQNERLKQILKYDPNHGENNPQAKNKVENNPQAASKNPSFGRHVDVVFFFRDAYVHYYENNQQPEKRKTVTRVDALLHGVIPGAVHKMRKAVTTYLRESCVDAKLREWLIDRLLSKKMRE